MNVLLSFNNMHYKKNGLFDWKIKQKTNHFDIWSNFDHLVILNKLIWTCPTRLMAFWLTIKWSFWLVKSDKKLSNQKNLIKNIAQFVNIKCK
jgi:hypothetical protein